MATTIKYVIIRLYYYVTDTKDRSFAHIHYCREDGKWCSRLTKSKFFESPEEAMLFADTLDTRGFMGLGYTISIAPVNFITEVAEIFNLAEK